MFVFGFFQFKSYFKKVDLCNKCRIMDQLTLIELMDDEYLRSTDLHHRYFLQDRIIDLPLPPYLKKFVNYNRTFDLSSENFYKKIEI